MSLIDDLIRMARAPLEFVRHRIWGIRSLEGRARGDWNRVRAIPGEFKGELQQDVAVARGLAPQKRGKKRGKMGLFAKRKKCPQCGEKLHVSWDLCPYCGLQSSKPMVAPVSSMTQDIGTASAGVVKVRTMALDLSSDRGGTNGVGWLVPLEGLQTGELFQLQGRCIVGTAPDCDVVLRDPSISSRHAEIVISGANCRISDLGSTNGTFVNDKRVTTSELIDNDGVQLGQIHFKFKAMS